MYILVEIIHTEFQYISLIEMQKYNWNRKKIEKRKTWKKWPFVPVGNTNRDKRVRQPRGRWLHLLSRLVLPTGTKGPLLSRLPDPGQKGTPFVLDWHSRLGNRDNRGFPTGTNQRFCSSIIWVALNQTYSEYNHSSIWTSYIQFDAFAKGMWQATVCWGSTFNRKWSDSARPSVPLTLYPDLIARSYICAYLNDMHD